MKYFLKRYLPVIKGITMLKIGVGSEFIEIENNQDSIDLIQKIVTVGLDMSEIHGTSLYHEMFNKKMLTQNNSRQRKEMYLDYLGITFDPELLNTRILILGSGGMGSTTTYLLAQFGFKHLTIVDFDVVAPSDIEKMMVYKKKDIGKLKTDSLKEIIESEFDYCHVDKIQAKVNSEADLEEIIIKSQAEFVIRAMDPKQIIFRFWLNSICFKRKIPFIVSSYAFEYLRLGPFCVPGLTSCDNCYNLWLIDGLGAEYDCSAQEKLFDDYSIHPTISFNINLASNFSLKDIIFFFSGKLENVSTLGKIIDYDALTLVGKSSIVPYHPLCKICRESIS